jgi:hypothetical protein
MIRRPELCEPDPNLAAFLLIHQLNGVSSLKEFGTAEDND